ncbi:MAG: hypothetical protein LBU81_04000 [Methanosarcinales archaeon]|jgi:hypothetical protein|nr:hypothetical protein [Methanosarcinales archaeon]
MFKRSKILKKVLTAFVISFMLLSLMSSSVAVLNNESKNTETISLSDKEQIYTVTYSEADIMKSLAKESSSSLAKHGYSASEIAIIKNYDTLFEEHIKFLNATCTDENLLVLGYTTEQISIIRDFENMNPTIQRSYSNDLAANLTVTLSAKSPLTYTNGVNKITLNYKYDWSRIPLMQFTDKLGLSWNRNEYVIDTSVHPNGIVPLKVKYLYVNGSSGAVNNITASLHTYGILYNITTKINGGINTTMQFADNAEGNLTLRYIGPKDTGALTVKLEYAHVKLPGGLGVSIGAAGAGFSYSPESMIDLIWRYITFHQTS